MPLIVTWDDLAVRLLATFIACAVVGLNRDQHGEPAGLRTTILVGMAAAVAMIQANIMLPTAGKEAGSFSVLDLMRLPLGILTGMGFIGGGAILRRGNLVMGVTTAATLWFVTVTGLCFGGGQIVLGIASTLICLVVLWVLKAAEAYIPQDRRAMLTMVTEPNCLSAAELVRRLKDESVHVVSQSVTYTGSSQEVCYDLQWRSLRREVRAPECLTIIAAGSCVQCLEWKSVGRGDA